MSHITVYTKPACVHCNATFRALDNAGIRYTAVDITEDTDAREYVLSLGSRRRHHRYPLVGLSPRPDQSPRGRVIPSRQKKRTAMTLHSLPTGYQPAPYDEPAGVGHRQRART